jgi:glutamine kinase
MFKFKFGTKAETLQRLKGKISNGVILDQLTISVKDWQKNKSFVKQQILKKFKGKKIVVRSSALNEDTASESMAGNYHSVLNVNTNSEKEIEEAFAKVIESYSTKGDNNPNNQLLIQPMVENVKMSGVLFTKDLDTNAPYLIFNYDDDTGSTSSVTGGNGLSLKIFTFYKGSDRLPSNSNLQKIVMLAKELEIITSNEALDIELAINDEDLYLL